MGNNFDEITFENRDEFNRKTIAETVVRLLASEANVSPMVIDGSWGTGKTEFCKKLINLFRSPEPTYKHVYIDAFSADHADEPLMTILAAILKLLPESKKSELVKKAIPALRFGLKTTFKASIGWVLRQDVGDLADQFDDDIKKASDEAINHSIEKLLADHVEADSSIETLRRSLIEITKENPIVIFVDELDRCRPDFAVKVLETIKHVFEIDGIQFVLVTNTDQLLASINHCYGHNIDAHRYLDKFLRFSFVLSTSFKRDNHNLMDVSERHLENLVRSSDLLKDSSLAKENVLEFVRSLIRENRLSLREVESFVSHCEFYQAITDQDGFKPNLILGYALLRAFGVFLYSAKPKLANQLSNGYVDAMAINNVLGKSGLFDLTSDESPHYGDVVGAIVGFEASQTDEIYQPATEELRVQWAEIIRSYFRNGISFPGDRRVAKMQSAINELKLCV